jgi:antitoxin HicB
MMNNLEYYKKLKYRMIVEYHPDDKAYFVKFPELPGCVADGATPEKAVTTALKVKDEWLETAYEAGWTIPDTLIPIEASGRITVRTPKYLHEKLVDRAQQEGVSLNQLMLSYLAEGLERATVGQRVEAAIEELTNKIQDRLEQDVSLNKIISIGVVGVGGGWPQARGKSNERIWSSANLIAECGTAEDVTDKMTKVDNQLGGRA